MICNKCGIELKRMTVKIDKGGVDKLLKELANMPGAVMKDAGVFFRAKTPIKTGNARSKTRQKDLTINADYGYAGRLDDGFSKQAPKGMSDPTIDQIDKLVDAYIRKL